VFASLTAVLPSCKEKAPAEVLSGKVVSYNEFGAFMLNHGMSRAQLETLVQALSVK
jgi:hypothetical protein